jgi:hypothetical protein
VQKALAVPGTPGALRRRILVGGSVSRGRAGPRSAR